MHSVAFSNSFSFSCIERGAAEHLFREAFA